MNFRNLYKIIITLTLLYSGALESFAQTQGIYVYRNDGDFNAFMVSEIDSMVCSKTGVDSVEYDKFITQEVWTADSVYRIPIATIDSISFKAPEPIVKNDVVFLKENHLPYIDAVEDGVIKFLRTTPSDLLPQIGQVIVSDVFEEPLQDGFAGRVKNKTIQGNCFVFACEDIELQDIYEQLICVGNCVSTNPNSQRNSNIRRINSENEKTFELPEFSVDFEVGEHGSVNFSVEPEITVKWAIKIIKDEKPNVEILFLQKYNMSAGLQLSFNGKYDPEPKWKIEVPIKTNVPGLFGSVKVGAFFNAEGSIDFNASFPFTATMTCGINSNEAVKTTPRLEFSKPDVSLNMEGEIALGIAARFEAAFISKKIAGVDLTLNAGPQAAAAFSISNEGLEEKGWDWYSSMKDSKIDFNLYAPDFVIAPPKIHQ